MSQKENLEAFLEHEEHLRILATNGEDGFMKEFMALKQQSMRYKAEKTYSTIEGEQDYNIRKNRYKDILPFDYTRIVLPELEDVEGSDYINANYITGIDGKNVYIAAQGPLPHTVTDFWRLLWETGVEVVIMACNEYESGKHKCEKYWADENETKQFGNIAVTLIRQLRVTPDFMIRTLKVNNQGEERVLNQFHYTAWPDHGVPKTVQPIMDMIQLFREYLPNEESPVVMHCSAGCGRTGTMICIDYVRALLKAGKVGADFCLYDIIMEMRKQRPAIVQTRDQYELVHRAVAWLFRKELGLAPNPHDFDHLYENVKLQNEGPRMPPGTNTLGLDSRTPQLKSSPKQRRHKDKEPDLGHNYVNHVIQGKGPNPEGSSSPTPVKILKPPSLPTKQQRDTESNETIYSNFPEKAEAEGKTAEDTVLSPVLTPKQSPLAQERFESSYKNTLAAFKEFETPTTQLRSSSPKLTEPAKPTLRSKPAFESRQVSSSKSLDLDVSKPSPPAKPPVGEKPAKVLSSSRPVPATKPVIMWKKEVPRGGSTQGNGQSTGLKRRPTSEPVHTQDQGGVQHLGTAQFQHAKNLVQATLTTKPEGDDGKESTTQKGKERRDSKARPTSSPPKPPTAVIKPVSKSPASRHQPYEEVGIASPPGKDLASSDKQDTSKGFQCQIQPVSTVRLLSHKDKVDAKSATKSDSAPNPMQRRKTVDLSRPQQPAPDSGSSEYSYATQPISVLEKLKDAQSRPQLKTGQGLSYTLAYADSADDGIPKEAVKARNSLDDYSYASEVIIPVTPSNTKAAVSKYRPNKKSSAQSTAYEVIQVSGPPGRRSSDGAGQDEGSVFDKDVGEYNEPNFSSSRQGSVQSPSSGQSRESVLSSTSYASFTDDDYDWDDESPPSIPEKTSAAYEFDGEEGDESGAGSSSKPKIVQFIAKNRDKLATQTEKLASNTKGFLTKIGDAVSRSTPASGGNRSSPPSTLSSSPQSGIVSDLNEIIKRAMKSHEPTYKEEPSMFNKHDISFPKRVPKPKSPPPVPNGWIKQDTHNATAPVQLRSSASS